MSDIDIVVFERAMDALREFDMALVKKNFSDPHCWMRITTIPKQYLDMIKQYLGESQTVWYVSTMNFNWASLMKDINADLHAFVERGGWNQIFGGSGGGDEEAGGNEEEDDDASDDWSGSGSGDDVEDDDDDDGGDDESFDDE